MSRNSHLVFAISSCALLTACDLSEDIGTDEAALAATCLQPESFGAVVNDGRDDQPALQAAIDAAPDGGCVQLAAGTYHARRRQNRSAVNKASLRISRPLTFKGAGAGLTTVAMLGSGIIPPDTSARAWTLLAVADGAHDVTISDLAVDGSQRTQTEEQTHLIELLGPTDHVVLERLKTVLPVIGPSAGGDCIRLLGSEGGWITNTTIRNVQGPDCDRSWLGIQRGVDGLLVEAVQTTIVGDQAIDFEPTGSMGEGPIVKNITLRNLNLHRGTTAGYTVAIAGRGSSVADNVTLENSTIADGSVILFDTSNVTLRGLNLSNPGGGTTLRAGKRQVNLRILDTTIEHRAGTTGIALAVGGQNGASPTDVHLDHVTITENADVRPVELSDLETFTATNTVFDYNGQPITIGAIHSAGLTRPVHGPRLTDCTVAGPVGTPVVTMSGQVLDQPVLIRVKIIP